LWNLACCFKLPGLDVFNDFTEVMRRVQYEGCGKAALACLRSSHA
jgi:hypothetical protein